MIDLNTLDSKPFFLLLFFYLTTDFRKLFEEHVEKTFLKLWDWRVVSKRDLKKKF